MIARARAAWLAFGVAGIALIGGLIEMARAPDEDDEIAQYNRLEAARRKASQEAELSGPVAIARTAPDVPALDPSVPIDPSRPSLVIAIGDDGFTVAGRTFTLDELDALFVETHDRDPATQVVLQAGSGVRHGTVVEVMERARAHGLTRLAISNQDPP